MKRVSFKVAKAIKDAGYPQGHLPFYDISGDLWEDGISDNFHFPCFAPTYVEVWLWLWREKKTHILLDNGAVVSMQDTDFLWHVAYQNNCSDPEESIKEAIEYLAENNLIK